MSQTQRWIINDSWPQAGWGRWQDTREQMKLSKSPSQCSSPGNDKVLWEYRRGDNELLLWGGDIWTESWRRTGSRERAGEVVHSYRGNRMCKGKEVLKSPRGPRETPHAKGLGSVGFQGEAGAGMLGPDCWSKCRFSLTSNRCSQSRGVTQSALYFGTLLLAALPTTGLRRLVAGRSAWQAVPRLVCSMAGAGWVPSPSLSQRQSHHWQADAVNIRAQP